MQDGTYTLVEKNFDTRGWKTEFSITVVDGKITASTYENVNEAGEKKSEDAEYQANMTGKVGVGPAEYFPALNSQLVEKQDPDAVEVVTGATNSSDTFKKYAQQLVDAAAVGETDRNRSRQRSRRIRPSFRFSGGFRNKKDYHRQVGTAFLFLPVFLNVDTG